MGKRALVLSGGGANGSYELGVLKYLIDWKGYDWEILCGTSVGALNAGFLAQYDSLSDGIRDLEQMWLDLKGDESIYKPWLPGLGPVGGFTEMSWYDSTPLWDLVAKKFDPTRVKRNKRRLVIGAVSLRTGCVRRWTNDSPPDEISKALLASSAFPAFFRPVEINGELWTDAGLREIIPVEDAVNEGAVEIQIITASPPESLNPWPDKPSSLNLSWRCLDIMSNEIIKGDLEKCEKAGLKVLRISPSHLLGDSLDFSPEKNRRLIEMGVNDAAKTFGQGMGLRTRPLTAAAPLVSKAPAVEVTGSPIGPRDIIPKR